MCVFARVLACAEKCYATNIGRPFPGIGGLLNRMCVCLRVCVRVLRNTMLQILAVHFQALEVCSIIHVSLSVCVRVLRDTNSDLKKSETDIISVIFIYTPFLNE